MFLMKYGDHIGYALLVYISQLLAAQISNDRHIVVCATEMSGTCNKNDQVAILFLLTLRPTTLN